MKKRGLALVLLFGLLNFLAGGAMATANLPGLAAALNREAVTACVPAVTVNTATATGAEEVPGFLLAGLAALAALAVLAGAAALLLKRLDTKGAQ